MKMGWRGVVGEVRVESRNNLSIFEFGRSIRIVGRSLHVHVDRIHDLSRIKEEKGRED